MHALIPLCTYVVWWRPSTFYFTTIGRQVKIEGVSHFIHSHISCILSSFIYPIITFLSSYVCPPIIFWIDHHMRHLNIFSCILFYYLVYYCYSTPICEADVSSTRSIAHASHFQYSNLYTYIRNYFGAHLISLPVLFYL